MIAEMDFKGSLVMLNSLNARMRKGDPWCHANSRNFFLGLTKCTYEGLIFQFFCSDNQIYMYKKNKSKFRTEQQKEYCMYILLATKKTHKRKHWQHHVQKTLIVANGVGVVLNINM